MSAAVITLLWEMIDLTEMEIGIHIVRVRNPEFKDKKFAWSGFNMHLTPIARFFCADSTQSTTYIT